MKGLQAAIKIPVTDVQVLSLRRLAPGEMQTCQLKDPVAIPPGGGLFRFQLWLENFAGAVENESLVRMIIEFENASHRSGIIYLGRY